jgi:hypothetical protein
MKVSVRDSCDQPRTIGIGLGIFRPLARGLGGALLLTAALSGCIKTESTVDVKPIDIKVEPLEATLNVNIHVQQEVNQSLDYLYGNAPAPGQPPKPATMPAPGN